MYAVGNVFTDLTKAFDCILNDLLIAKLDAYSFNKNLVRYIYSCLKKRKQRVRINSVTSSLKNILSGFPQWSILEPTLFNLF